MWYYCGDSCQVPADVCYGMYGYCSFMGNPSRLIKDFEMDARVDGMPGPMLVERKRDLVARINDFINLKKAFGEAQVREQEFRCHQEAHLKGIAATIGSESLVKGTVLHWGDSGFRAFLQGLDIGFISGIPLGFSLFIPAPLQLILCLQAYQKDLITGAQPEEQKKLRGTR
jgi:hypothetical protein